MHITIDHEQISDKIIKNELFLYIPKNILEYSFDDVKLMEWINYWGFRVNYKKNKTEVIIPQNFDLSNCFYKRLEFQTVIGLNIDLDKNISSQDLVKIFYYRFLKSSDIVDNKSLLLLGYKENDKGYFNKTLQYKYFLNMFNLKIDRVIYEKDLDCKYNSEKFLNNFDSNRFLNLVSPRDKKIKSEIFTIENISMYRYKFLIGDKILTDIIEEISEYFDNKEISFNCLMSFVFQNPRLKTVEISKDLLKNTLGYKFYETQKKVKDLGMLHDKKSDRFNSNLLQYYYSKSVWFFNPKFLQNALSTHCDKINKLLDMSNFKPSEDEHIKIYAIGMLEDLELGMKKLGMFV